MRVAMDQRGRNIRAAIAQGKGERLGDWGTFFPGTGNGVGDSTCCYEAGERASGRAPSAGHQAVPHQPLLRWSEIRVECWRMRKILWTGCGSSLRKQACAMKDRRRCVCGRCWTVLSSYVVKSPPCWILYLKSHSTLRDVLS